MILPDVRGLYRFYEELALRFAERGHAAVAFDYFGRTAEAEKRGDDFEYMPHVRQTTAAGVQADVGAAARTCAARGASASSPSVLLRRRHSWLATAGGHDLAGAVGFYGRPGTGSDGSPGPTQRAAEMRPDPGPHGWGRPGYPALRRRGVRRGARGRGVEHEVVVYGRAAQLLRPQTGEFAAESEDAWNRVLAFLERHS